MKITAIPRAPENSPNMSEKDNMLLCLIAKKLQSRGHTVKFGCTEECDAIFHMTRTRATLERIAEEESKGIYVTNPTEGVANCSREKLLPILEREGIRQPAYRFITDADCANALEYPGWLKNADGWSCHIDDVQYIANADELEAALKRLMNRGCRKAIYCEHIEGDIIKFYGIAGEKFFRWHYPNPETTKFGLEKINGQQQGHCFAEEELREQAFAAAHAAGIEIFGGDCIITSAGEIYIIDLNDFPSFSAYREEAAESIATLIERKGKR